MSEGKTKYYVGLNVQFAIRANDSAEAEKLGLEALRDAMANNTCQPNIEVEVDESH